MAIELVYRDDGGIVLIGRGTLTSKAIQEANARMYESPEKIAKIRYQIVDYRGIEDVEAETLNVRKTAAQDKLAAKINPDMVIVVIAPTDLPFALARMWDAYLLDSGLETRVVRSMEEAECWLRERLPPIAPLHS